MWDPVANLVCALVLMGLNWSPVMLWVLLTEVMAWMKMLFQFLVAKMLGQG